MHLIELTVKMIHAGQGSQTVSGLSPTQWNPNFAQECQPFGKSDDDTLQSIVNFLSATVFRLTLSFHVVRAEGSTRRPRCES
jgi:hypothetical protein